MPDKVRLINGGATHAIKTVLSMFNKVYKVVGYSQHSFPICHSPTVCSNSGGGHLFLIASDTSSRRSVFITVRSLSQSNSNPASPQRRSGFGVGVFVAATAARPGVVVAATADRPGASPRLRTSVTKPVLRHFHKPFPTTQRLSLASSLSSCICLCLGPNFASRLHSTQRLLNIYHLATPSRPPLRPNSLCRMPDRNRESQSLDITAGSATSL